MQVLGGHLIVDIGHGRPAHSLKLDLTALDAQHDRENVKSMAP